MRKLTNLIQDELCGDRAKQHAAYLTQFMRTPASSGIRTSLDYAEAKMRACGLDKISRIEFESESGWDVSDAELRVVSPLKDLIVSYSEAPTCIQWWSEGTPTEGVTAELVDIGSGLLESDYEGKNVKGKVVLAFGDGHAEGNDHAYSLAMQFGAVGFVTDSLLYPQPPVRTRVSQPEAVQMLRTPKLGKGWGFSISHTKAQILRRLLEQGPVRVWARIDARNYWGKDHVLVGEITGAEKTDEEVWFVAHCSGTKPGANCAAGVGLWLEQARLFTYLIQTGGITRPKRTIRFILGAEGLGINAYLHHLGGRLPKVLCAFVYCSVGNDQEKCNSSLVMFKSPESIPSYVNQICQYAIKAASKDATPPFKDVSRDLALVRFNVAPYTPWSDNSTLMRLKIPCPLFMSWPDTHFHTQFLTSDKIDPKVIARCGLVTSSVGLLIADAGIDEARTMLMEVRWREEQAISSTISEAYHALMEAKDPSTTESSANAIRNDYETKVKYVIRRASGAINALQELLSSSKELQEFEAECSKCQQELSRKASAERTLLNSLISKWEKR
jgi:hypothetical protein